MPKKTTKSDTILKLINRKSGASLAQLVKATVWKTSSVHAALTGLRKQGIKIERRKSISNETLYQSTGR